MWSLICELKFILKSMKQGQGEEGLWLRWRCAESMQWKETESGFQWLTVSMVWRVSNGLLFAGMEGGQSKRSGRVPIRGESITYCTKWVPEAKTGRQAGGVQRGSGCNQTAWLQEDWRPNEGKYCYKYCRGSVMTSWIIRTERHTIRILVSMKSQDSQTLTRVHCRCGKDLLSVLVLNTTSLIADRWDCWMETPPRGGAPGLWKNTTLSRTHDTCTKPHEFISLSHKVMMETHAFRNGQSLQFCIFSYVICNDI